MVAKLKLVVVLLALGAAGCRHGATNLRPAEEAERVALDPGAARAQVAGVELEADVSAWTGAPEELRSVLPVQVTIRNRGERAIRLRLQEFSLLGAEGKRLSALPPLSIHGTEMMTVRVPAWDPTLGIGGSGVPPLFYHRGLAFAPPYAGYYGMGPVWPGAFAYDPGWYDVAYERWPVTLPTSDMIAQALPESVIQPGGEVRGFVYFEPPTEADRRLRLQFELVDAASGETLGTAEIPFVRPGA